MPASSDACEERSDLASSIDWKRNLRTVSYATGIGAAIFTLGYLGYRAWGPPERAGQGEQALLLQPMVAKHEWSLQLRKAF